MSKMSLAKRYAGMVKENRSLLLSVGALIGFGATVYFVAKGQMKADDILAERNEACKNPFDETVYPPSVKEKAELTWQCYIPAGIFGVLTVGCIIGSQYISRKEIAGLSASVAFLTANRDGLEKAIKEKYGDDALEEIKSKLAVRKPDPIVLKVIAEETGNGDLLCFEGYSGRWFRSSKRAVEYAEKELNKRFVAGGYVSMNDFYEFLGIEQTHFGWEFGWPGSDEYLDFYMGSALPGSNENPIRFDNTVIFDEEKSEDVLYIDLYTYPMEGWQEL